jgi:hypothetical protein
MAYPAIGGKSAHRPVLSRIRIPSAPEHVYRRRDAAFFAVTEKRNLNRKQPLVRALRGFFPDYQSFALCGGSITTVRAVVDDEFASLTAVPPAFDTSYRQSCGCFDGDGSAARVGTDWAFRKWGSQ